MEWFVPARIAMIKWDRNDIIRNKKHGSDILEKVGDEISGGVRFPSKDRYTVGHITYKTATQKKIGGYIAYRKREKVSKSVQGQKKMRLLIEDNENQ